MEYSVEDMCNLTKVSVRTLHYYDEIDLLKPVSRGANGRRSYDEAQVLRMFDIIFFKKMGFNLDKIKSMLNLGNKDKRALMLAKKEFLQKEMQRTEELIKSIDVTLEIYFKGENLNSKQIIKQFESIQKTTKEDKECFEKQFGSFEDEEAKKLKNMSLKDQQKHWKEVFEKVDMKKYSEKMASCLQKLIECIDNNKKENSKEVQKLMQEYFEAISMIHQMSKKKWLGMGVNIVENKEGYIIFAKMHPKLPEFLAKAIKIYADNIIE